MFEILEHLWYVSHESHLVSFIVQENGKAAIKTASFIWKGVRALRDYFGPL